MLKVKLERVARSTHGVFGRMKVRNATLWTIEEEDLGNQRNISCIPAGTYRCKPRRFYRGGYDTYEVTGVPGRSLILFHIGNTEEDIAGCIAVGTQLGVLDVIDEDSGERVPKLAVLGSAPAFMTFMRQLEGVPEFDIEITEPRA